MTKLSREESSFKVLMGEVYAKIAKIGKGEFVNIYSPTCVTGVRGTEFGLEVKRDGTSKVVVIKGIIEFSDVDKKSGVGQRSTKVNSKTRSITL